MYNFDAGAPLRRARTLIYKTTAGCVVWPLIYNMTSSLLAVKLGHTGPPFSNLTDMSFENAATSTSPPLYDELPLPAGWLKRVDERVSDLLLFQVGSL